MDDLGVYLKSAFLLIGPSGCGKTLIVEALANEAGAKLMRIMGRTLVNLYGDQGEWVVRLLFSYARTCSPCILFFDELDVIASKLNGKELPVFIQLLTELGHPVEGSCVYVIAATNKSDLIVHSWIGNYKFDKVLYVSLPTPEERGAILKALARNKPIDANVDLMALGKDIVCKNFSGADLSALMKGAIKAAFDRPISPGEDCRAPLTIKDVDFKSALKGISPSVPRTQV